MMNPEQIMMLSLLPKAALNFKTLTRITSSPKPCSVDEVLQHLDADLLLTEELENLITLAESQSESIVETTEKMKVRFTHYWQADYPARLRMMKYPPLVLFYYGSIAELGKLPVLAVVGSRVPSHYGVKVLDRILGVFEKDEIEHVSGLAQGIDSMAHFRTLSKGIRNFAVLGSGLDEIYPASNESLAREIIMGGGALISEYPVGTLPKAMHFPWRNRIISGLSNLIWIPEATAKSGTRHTVQHALGDQRFICATPGDVDREQSQLPNQVIRDGGNPIIDHEDLRSCISISFSC